MKRSARVGIILLSLWTFPAAQAATITNDVLSLRYQGTTFQYSVSGTVFNFATSSVSDTPFYFPFGTYGDPTGRGTVGSPVTLGVFLLPSNLPGTINLNGTVQNTNFYGEGIISSYFVVPILAPSTQLTLVLPATVTCCSFSAGFPNVIANISINYTGTETLFLASDASAFETLTGVIFNSTSSADQVKIPAPPGIPEPGTFALGLGGLSLIWLRSRRKSSSR